MLPHTPKLVPKVPPRNNRKKEEKQYWVPQRKGHLHDKPPARGRPQGTWASPHVPNSGNSSLSFLLKTKANIGAKMMHYPHEALASGMTETEILHKAK